MEHRESTNALKSTNKKKNREKPQTYLLCTVLAISNALTFL